MICYDAEFPEWIHYSMLAGAQNKIVIAACDRGWDENGIYLMSSSVIVDSNGVLQSIASSRGEEIIYSEVELPTVDVIGPRNSIKADRRDDLDQRFSVT